MEQGVQVRAKFVLNAIELTKGSDRTGKAITFSSFKMTPVYDSNPESENGKFFGSTPSGELRMGVLSQEAAKQFELGKEYYLDFSQAN